MQSYANSRKKRPNLLEILQKITILSIMTGSLSEVKKLNGLICHGLLVASMITEIGGQIGWLASGMDFRFKKPVYFEDTITCTFKITEINEKGKAKGEAVYRNQNGTVVLEATLKGILPGLKEKEVLKALI